MGPGILKRGTVPQGWTWDLCINPRARLQVSKVESQRMGAPFSPRSAVLSPAFPLSAREPATLADLPKSPRHSVAVQQFSDFYLLGIETC